MRLTGPSVMARTVASCALSRTMASNSVETSRHKFVACSRLSKISRHFITVSGSLVPSKSVASARRCVSSACPSISWISPARSSPARRVLSSASGGLQRFRDAAYPVRLARGPSSSAELRRRARIRRLGAPWSGRARDGRGRGGRRGSSRRKARGPSRRCRSRRTRRGGGGARARPRESEPRAPYRRATPRCVRPTDRAQRRSIR